MSDQRFPWRTLLFISVAINLLAVGAVVGAAGAGVRIERSEQAAQLPAPRVFIAALPQPTRTKMRVALAQTWIQIRDLRQQAVQARRDAYAAAATEPYDPERVRAAFARVRAADAAALAAYHDNIIAAFATLTPAERHQALEALRNVGGVRQSLAPTSGEQGARATDTTDQAGAPLRPRQALRAAIRERMRERRGMTP